jgi:aryl-alcohol dehydrogenase-like predicted oxidoreductase
MLGRLASVAPALIERPIPSTGTMIPIVGIGTARRYDVAATSGELAPLREVLRRFPELGGRLVDTAPSYGNAETVVGKLVCDLGNRDSIFLATKVAVRSGGKAAIVAQMEESLRRLHTDRIDLMQIHNLTNVAETVPVLQEWKAARDIRHFGVTTSSEDQYEAFEAAMRAHPFDAIQVNYSIESRQAANRILPLAADRGMAVLVNLPFGRTSVFEKVEGKPLPGWAAEIDCTTWAQVFLKYIVSHPSVTCAIPGTAKVEYLTDNLAAARGRLPDAAMRKRIEAYYDAL